MLGFVHENCQLGHLGPELVGDLTPLDLRAVGVLLGESGGDEGGDDAPALAAGMGQQVAGEVHAAALPCGAEDPGRGGLQALVVVGDHQLHAAQPAPGQRAQELGPEGLCLRRADRHTDGRGLVLEAHPASIQDRDGGGPLLCASRGSFPFIEKVFADSGYAGEKVATATVIAVEIVRKSPDQVGFAVQPRRWVVERFFAWINRNRRLAKDFEATIASARAFLYAASVMLLVRRLARAA